MDERAGTVNLYARILLAEPVVLSGKAGKDIKM